MNITTPIPIHDGSKNFVNLLWCYVSRNLHIFQIRRFRAQPITFGELRLWYYTIVSNFKDLYIQWRCKPKLHCPTTMLKAFYFYLLENVTPCTTGRSAFVLGNVKYCVDNRAMVNVIVMLPTMAHPFFLVISIILE